MDIVTGPLDALRRVDVRVRTGMPGPEGPAGPIGPEGPVGPPGPEGRVTQIVGEFGAIRTPDELPIDGLIPVDWDGPGRPPSELQVEIGQSLAHVDGRIFALTGEAWLDLGTIVGPIGPRGPQGEIGPSGPQGPPGSAGAQGAAGPAGAQGPIGPSGAQGGAGPAGPQGSAGPAGPQGPAGAKGDQGDQGEQGEIGPVGPPSFADAPSGNTYGRLNGSWIAVVPASGGAVHGPLTVEGPALFADTARMMGALSLDLDPTQPQHAVTMGYVDLAIGDSVPDLSPFARLDGATMKGPLVLDRDPTSDLDAATKGYVDGSMPDIDFSPYLRKDGGAMIGPLTLDRDPTVFDQAATKRYVDALVPDLDPYLRKEGGQMSGTLISAPGTGVTNPGIAIGDNSTGFLKSGSYLGIIASGQLVAQANPTEWQMAIPINMSIRQIINLAEPTAPAHATTRNYVDLRRASSQLVNVPADFDIPVDGSWATLSALQYPIPRGGLSRVMVSLLANVKLTGSGGGQGTGIVVLAARIQNNPEQHIWVFGLQPTGPGGASLATGINVNLIADLLGFNPVVTIQLSMLDGGSQAPRQPMVIIGGNVTVADRSQFVVMDLGPTT